MTTGTCHDSGALPVGCSHALLGTLAIGVAVSVGTHAGSRYIALACFCSGVIGKSVGVVDVIAYCTVSVDRLGMALGATEVVTN